MEVDLQGKVQGQMYKIRALHDPLKSQSIMAHMLAKKEIVWHRAGLVLTRPPCRPSRDRVVKRARNLQRCRPGSQHAYSQSHPK